MSAISPSEGLLVNVLAKVHKKTIMSARKIQIHNFLQMETIGLWLLLMFSSHAAGMSIIDARLVNGSSSREGRVAVNVEGVGWNTVCGISWDFNDVMVICRQLGFSGALFALQGVEFGSGSLAIAKDTLSCKGEENNLADCSTTRVRCGARPSVAGAICQRPSYLGCYGDDRFNRPLSADSYHDTSNMTIDRCISYCRDRGFAYAGIELGSECYCGDEGANYSLHGRYSDRECGHVCPGNPLEICGGISRMAVYLTALPTTTTIMVPTTDVRYRTLSDRSGDRPTTSPGSNSHSNYEGTPSPRQGLDTSNLMVYILVGLLIFCVIVIVICTVWNCRLRSRQMHTHAIARTRKPRVDEENNACSYMHLSERRTDPSGYQSLSVQRKAHKDAAKTEAGDDEAGVYMEPAVYTEPDEVMALSHKPGQLHSSEPEAVGNEYETFQIGT